MAVVGQKVVDIYTLETLTYDGKVIAEVHVDLSQDLEENELISSVNVLQDTVYMLVENRTKQEPS